MSFQGKINRDLPRGVAGDFASTNPRNSILAGEAALRAGEQLNVGQFGFADLQTGIVMSEYVAGRVIGFVHRNNQGIVAIGEEATMVVPQGRAVALYSAGDFYIVSPGPGAAGEPIYALEATGAVSLVAAASQETNFVLAENAVAGQLVKITRFSI